MAEYLLPYAAIPLRLILGIIFIKSGYPKLFKNFQQTVGMMQGLNFTPAWLWAFTLSFTEFFGGLALLLGLVTRAGAALLFIAMLVATLVKKYKWGKTFKEYMLDLSLLAGLATLLFLGAGTLSIDSMIGWILG
jgi:putative oxidoreductase